MKSQHNLRGHAVTQIPVMETSYLKKELLLKAAFPSALYKLIAHTLIKQIGIRLVYYQIIQGCYVGH
jgi:hypothetical protein